MNLTRNLYCAIYYGFAQYLPDSYTPIVGKMSKYRHILKFQAVFLIINSHMDALCV